MNEEVPAPWRLITPFQWVVIVLVAVVGISLLVALGRAPAKADPNSVTRYPRVILVGGAGGTETYRTKDAFTNVSAWYGTAFKAPLMPARSPFFWYSSSSWFGSRRGYLENGRFAPAGTNWQHEFFLRKGNDQLVLIHLSQRQGDSNTCIQVTDLRVSSSRPGAVGLVATLPSLVPPRAIMSTSSSSMNTAFRSATIRTNLTAVMQWYAEGFGKAVTNRSSTTRTNLDVTYPLFVTVTNHIDWIYRSGNMVAIIHAEATGSNTTEVIIGAGTY